MFTPRSWGDTMSGILRVLISALLLTPAVALGLGLGEIRLNSALNQPLSAEIDLVAATPEELASLNANLAASEIFARYGLDRPAFLSSLEFTVGRGNDGRSVLLVRSRDAITEPFVSFLVDVNWPRGRLLREYTVLLDPPAVLSAAESPVAVPIAAPVTMAPAAPARPVPEEPAPQAAPEPAPEPAADAQPASAVAGSSSFEVARGDTLYGIASKLAAGDRQSIQRTMIALFRANPQAFNGNINQLRAGAILRVPTSEEIAGIGAGEAAGEVRDQTAAWRAAGGGQESGRLQLETPQPPDEAAVAPEDDLGREAVPPAEPEQPKRARPKPAAKADAGPSLFDTLADNWLLLLGAAALVVLGLLGFNFIRRRRNEDVDGALKGFDLPATAPIPTETMRLRALATGESIADRTAEMVRPPVFESRDEDDEDQDIVVEERPVARPRTEAPRPSVSHEETISAEAAIDLDQAEPLAEADFHMAYGLYDQAVDLVRMALQKEPGRNDLKLKLAEIHFVAGDTSQFLAIARDLKQSLGAGAEWDRIVIMGRQLAPDDAMFAGAVQDAGVDLSLEGGDNLVDLDLLSAPDGDEGLDLDLGKVAEAEPTGEHAAVEFDLGDASMSFSTTQDIGGQEGGGTVEMPTLELPSSETPTVETPGLKASQQAVRDRMQPATPESTAEMAIEDLDLGNLDSLPGIDDATAIAAGVHDETTLIAQRGHEHTTVLERIEETDRTALMPAGADGATAVLPRVDFGEVDLDTGGPDASDSSPTAGGTLRTEQMPQLSQPEPVTMSEVGTKLDLARVYMDMGDPDGARNILQEVLAEGSASRKQEARRLIDSLPGA
ncbi:MAG: hypothetical protein FJ171_07835 [Gammaproteobacteria bacterium]|nr:hypothetical protein [Gammaproteobacteria bacterium]